ncbi:MAG: hypothetical protein HQK49_17680 [Oligoflexia bacterium]|nr:hypothetical protein [Oligoflexia bacterium]
MKTFLFFLFLLLSFKSAPVVFAAEEKIDVWKDEKYRLVVREFSKEFATVLRQNININQQEINKSNKKEVRECLNIENILDDKDNNSRYLCYLKNISEIVLNDDLLNQSEMNGREKYYTIVKNIRAALSTNFYMANKDSTDNQWISLIQNASFILYSQINIRPFVNELTFKVSKYPKISLEKVKEEKDSKINLLNYLEQVVVELTSVHKKILEAPNEAKIDRLGKIKQTLIGHLKDTNFDPILQSNVPYQKLIYKYKNNKDKLCLHLGTPTIRNDESAEVNPEFKGFLKFLEKNNLKHTYVSFQSNIPASMFKWITRQGDESYRAHCLEKLSADLEFRKTLTFAALDKDSDDFYWQKSGAFLDEYIYSKDFYKKFEERVFNSRNKGFFLSDAAVNHKDQMISLIKSLMDSLYPKGKYLSRSERKNFIELAYLLIMDNLSSDSYSLNFSCKDDIDRGTAAKAMLFLATFTKEILDTQKRGEDYDPKLFVEKTNHFISSIFADALMVRKREIIDERLKRFQEVAIFFINQIKTNKQFKEFFINNFNFTEVSAK